MFNCLVATLGTSIISAHSADQPVIYTTYTTQVDVVLELSLPSAFVLSLILNIFDI